MFGRKQEICVGFMSGASNVSYWLTERGIPNDESLVKEIGGAKGQNHILSDDEVMAAVRRVKEQ